MIDKKKILLLVSALVILFLSIINTTRLRQAYDTVQLQREAIQTQADIIDKLKEELANRTRRKLIIADHPSDPATSYLISELLRAMDSHQYYVDNPDTSSFNKTGFTMDEWIDWNTHWIEVYEQVINYIGDVK